MQQKPSIGVDQKWTCGPLFSWLFPEPYGRLFSSSCGGLQPKLPPTYSLDCTGLHWTSRKCCTVHYFCEVQCSPVQPSEYVAGSLGFLLNPQDKISQEQLKKVMRSDVIRWGHSKLQSFQKSDKCQGKFPSWGNLPICRMYQKNK